jgi:hypothetical protein
MRLIKKLIRSPHRNGSPEQTRFEDWATVVPKRSWLESEVVRPEVYWGMSRMC